MDEKKFTVEILGKPIEASIYDTGGGISCIIAGGERAHIGAVSVKYPGCELSSIRLEDHKDHIISDKWALALSEAFDTAVSVSCGIHYDNITKEGIALIVSELDMMLKQVMTCLEK